MPNSKALRTARIVHDDGYMIINDRDFDPDIHELYETEVPTYLISAKAEDDSAVYWGEDGWGDRAKAKVYKTDAGAESAIERTTALQASINDSVTDPAVVEA